MLRINYTRSDCELRLFTCWQGDRFRLVFTERPCRGNRCRKAVRLGCIRCSRDKKGDLSWLRLTASGLPGYIILTVPGELILSSEISGLNLASLVDIALAGTVYTVKYSSC